MIKIKYISFVKSTKISGIKVASQAGRGSFMLFFLSLKSKETYISKQDDNCYYLLTFIF